MLRFLLSFIFYSIDVNDEALNSMLSIGITLQCVDVVKGPWGILFEPQLRP